MADTNACAASPSSITENRADPIGLKGTAGNRNMRPSGLGTCGPTTGASRNKVAVVPRAIANSLALCSKPSSIWPKSDCGSSG